MGNIFNNKKIKCKNFIINDVIEKPKVKNAPSNNAVIGRYILPKDIFKIFKNKKKVLVERYILQIQ